MYKQNYVKRQIIDNCNQDYILHLIKTNYLQPVKREHTVKKKKSCRLRKMMIKASAASLYHTVHKRQQLFSSENTPQSKYN